VHSIARQNKARGAVEKIMNDDTVYITENTENKLIKSELEFIKVNFFQNNFYQAEGSVGHESTRIVHISFIYTTAIPTVLLLQDG